MKVKHNYVFFGFPAYSHTNPTIMLVRNLIELGHSVTYYNRKDLKKIIETTGANFIDYDSISLMNTCIPGTEIPSLQIQDFHIELHRMLFTCTIEILPKLLSVTTNFDAVIYDQFAIWSQMFADNYNIPSFCSSPLLLDTTESLLSQLPAFELLDGYYKYKLNLVKAYAPSINTHKDILDYITCNKSNWVITYHSPELQPKAYELFYNDRFIYLGNRFDSQYTPSEANLDSKALIYISLGTIFNGNLTLFKGLVDFFNNTDYQVIISAGNNDMTYYQLQKLKIKTNISIHKFINQLDVLSKCALFITHAGLNSLYEGLYFTVPMIMIPQMGEQYINACRIQELAAGYLLEMNQNLNEELLKAINNIKGNWQKYKLSASTIRNSFLKSYDNRSVAEKIESLVNEV